jgi:hypothetical protein
MGASATRVESFTDNDDENSDDVDSGFGSGFSLCCTKPKQRDGIVSLPQQLLQSPKGRQIPLAAKLFGARLK